MGSVFCEQIPSEKRQAATALKPKWPGLLLDPPFFFTAHTIAKSVRNPKPAQFTSIHESVTSASLQASLRWAGRLWVESPSLIFSNSVRLLNEPSIFLKQETGPACVGILHCCGITLVFFCFISIYFTRTDGECVFDLRWN